MPDGEHIEPPAHDASCEARHPEPSGGGVFSPYGIASTVLGLVSVIAVVAGLLIWSAHRADTGERAYLTRVMQAAAEWAGVLINMNAANVDASLQQLHDGTVGELNVDFDAAVQPYRQVVEKLQTQSTGKIEGLAIEAVRHDPAPQPDAVPTTTLLPLATRTDAVLVVAISIAENAGAKPQTVHWNLRLDVANVAGALMISHLETIR